MDGFTGGGPSRFAFSVGYGSLSGLSAIAVNREIYDAVNIAWSALLADGDGRVANTSASVEKSFFAALSKDSEATVAALFSTPLWPDGTDDTGVDIKSLERVARHRSEWSFWARWYDGFLGGEPLDWRLQEEIALIPEAAWEAGPERIAELIERIEAEFLARTVPLAERITFDADAELFRRETIEIERPGLIVASLDGIADALEDALAKTGNSLGEDNRAVRTLRRTLTRYANDPQRIEMNLTSVVRSLTRQMVETEDLPPSEENQALREAAAEGARAIRGAHPEIAENRRILDGEALREMKIDELTILAGSVHLLQKLSETSFGEEFEEDVRTLIGDLYPLGQIPPIINDAIGPSGGNAPPLGGVDASQRIFSRIAKMSVQSRIEDTADILAKKLGLTRGEVYALFGTLVSIGIGLL